MQTINIYLPHDLRQQIQLRAERDKKPQAQVIRELLEKGMQVEKPPMSGEGLLKIARLAVKGAPPDFSENIDTYLYEKP
jgi:hypothetical protein